MADLYASLLPVRLNDGTADANNAVITNAAPSSSAYALAVRQVGTSAAAALADATANPTTTGAAGFSEIFNGTTWDRQRAISAALDSTGTGITASGVIGQLDDVATAAVTENQFAPVRISTRRALLIEGVASGTAIATTVSGTVTVDSELPAAAAMADGVANPTVPAVAAFGTVWNGATWDRLAGAATGGVQVQGWTAHDGALAAGFPLVVGGRAQATAPTDVSADGDAVRAWFLRSGAQATVLTAAGALIGGDVGNGLDVDVTRVGGNVSVIGSVALDAPAAAINPVLVGTYASAAAPTDVSADGDAVRLWALRNGAQVVNLASGGTLITAGQAVMASSLPVVIASNQSAIAVDSELPAAAALADATANPTVPAVGAFLVGYNGTTWDRVRTANTGRLQVDVITGGGSPPASEIPSGYNALIAYGSTTNTAAAGTASVVTNTPANTKPFYIKSIVVAASGVTMWQVKFGATVLATGFNPSSSLTAPITFSPPLTGTGDGTTALTVDVTNREASAMNLYARMAGYVLA